MTTVDPGDLDAQIDLFGAMRHGSYQIDAAARNGGYARANPFPSSRSVAGRAQL
jgi:hypothetical protein